MDDLTKTTEHSLRRGKTKPPEAFDICVSRLGYALRHIDDRSKLNGSPLAGLAYVKRLAEEEYRGHILPRGLALRQLILSCVEDVVSDVGKDGGLSRSCRYLRLRTAGFSCNQIGKEMGLSREHVSRFYRRKALELLTERFLATINSDTRPQIG